MPNLIGDVAAVIAAEGQKDAIVIGHDWGAAIAWQTVLNRPELVNRLVILSVPHPAGMARELATNKDQQANSQYARNFQKEGSEKSLTAEGLAGWVKDAKEKPGYVEAFRRWRLRPRMLVDVSAASIETTVLGEEVSMPLLVAPTAFQRMAHPDG